MWQTKPEREQKAETKRSRWGFRGKTAWDWMDLLIVPLVLVVIGLVFTMLQDARQQDLENQRAQQAQKIENQRAEAERELAEQRSQDEALQAYLDQMSMLMLEKDLRNSDEDSEVRTLARARTLTVIRRVDASRKGEILQFLLEADLVHRVDGSAPVIGLGRADLGEAFLSGADLSGADLSSANLSGANLSEALLFGANLGVARLGETNFLGVPDRGGADLSNANLRKAELGGASLIKADLSSANLRGAALDEANLQGANLQGADLSGARGWTEGQLTATGSLEGTTMPNGQVLKGDNNPDGPTFEDWFRENE